MQRHFFIKCYHVFLAKEYIDIVQTKSLVPSIYIIIIAIKIINIGGIDDYNKMSLNALYQKYVPFSNNSCIYYLIRYGR